MKKLSWLLVAVLILFIFSNSCMNAEASSNMSTPIAEWVWLHLPFECSLELVQFAVRKLAHFSEYALLGLCVFSAQKISPLALNSRLLISLFLFVPVIDETIQRFSDGRSSEIRDMLIDACGYLCGVLFAFLLWHIFFRRRKINDVKMES